MLSNIFICVVLVLVVIAAFLFIMTKHYHKKATTMSTEYDLLRNRYNALESNYNTLQATIKAKQEVKNEKDNALADIASGSVDDSIERLQNRNRKRNNKNGSSGL